MRHLVVVAICALISASAATAAPPAIKPKPFPVMDVNAACRAAYDSGNPRIPPNVQLVNACIEAEQLSYDSGRYYWSELSQERREWCLDRSQGQAPLFYTYLETCLHTWWQQERSLRPRQFNPR